MDNLKEKFEEILQEKCDLTEEDIDYMRVAGNRNCISINECMNCMQVAYDMAQNKWISVDNKLAKKTQTASIIQQTLQYVAENATVFLPFHSHLHGTKNIDKKHILNMAPDLIKLIK